MTRFLTSITSSLCLTALVAGTALADDRADVQARVDAVYAVISGPVGEARDFDAMRAMFVPGAVMGAVSPGPDGTGQGGTFSVDGYIERASSFLIDNGFTERATRTDLTVYGEIAYVRSAYEGVSGLTGETVVSGVNFFTLFKVEGDWQVASLLWRAATDDMPVDLAFESE